MQQNYYKRHKASKNIHKNQKKITNQFIIIATLMTSLTSQVWAEEAPSEAPSSYISPEELETMEVLGTEMGGTSYNVPNSSTATKTDTPIMEIPQSIQVLPEAVLRDQNLQTISSAVENISSVIAPKSTELLTSEFIVRGFKSQFYLDGMPAFGQANVADPLSLVNVSRIEVAKGPTATLFGGGLGAPIGGLINVVSKAPLTESQYSLAFRGGSFDTYNPSFDINQPITSDDKVLFRLTGEYENSESSIDEVNSEQYSLYPTLSVDFSDETRLVIRGQYSHIKFLEYTGLRAEGTIADAPYSIPRFRYSGAKDTPDSIVENKMLTADLSHRFSSHIKASVQARYYESEFEEFSSFHHGSLNTLDRPRNSKPSELPFYSGFITSSVKQFIINPNLTLDFEMGFFKHKVLLGAEYDLTENISKLGTLFSVSETPDIFLDVTDRNDDINYLNIADGSVNESRDNTYQTIGVYLQDQLDFGDRLHILASVRWTNVKVDEINKATKKNKSSSNSSVTPRGGIVFDLTDEVSIFAGYGEGFRAVLAMFGDTAKPELSDQVEGGIKFDFANLGLSGTIAGYRLVRENVSVPDPNSAFSSIQAGEQTALGGEIDFMWEPNDSLSILGNYAYTDATLTKHPNTRLGVGDFLPRVPKHSGRAAFRYRFYDGIFKGLGLGAGITLSSSRHISLPNTFKTKGFYRVDAQASYPLTENLDLTVNIQNLTNNKYYEPFLFLQDEVVSPGAPISAFATITATF